MLAPSTEATPGGFTPACGPRGGATGGGAAQLASISAAPRATPAERLRNGTGTPHPEILNNPLAAAKDLSKGRLRNHEGAAARSPQIAVFEEPC